MGDFFFKIFMDFGVILKIALSLLQLYSKFDKILLAEPQNIVKMIFK